MVNRPNVHGIHRAIRINRTWFQMDCLGEYEVQVKFVKVNQELYKTVGTEREGYVVYKEQRGCFTHMGRSNCISPRMAVNDVLERGYKRYY